jgi:hypothetical protein
MKNSCTTKCNSDTDETRPAPGTAVLRKNRAIYLNGDQIFGQWSVSLASRGRDHQALQ